LALSASNLIDFHTRFPGGHSVIGILAHTFNAQSAEKTPVMVSERLLMPPAPRVRGIAGFNMVK